MSDPYYLAVMQAVIGYLQNVLGVRYLTMIEQAQICELIFLLPNLESPQERELLQKMIQAMKLAENRFQVLHIKPAEISDCLIELESCQAVISFSSAISEFIKNNFPRIPLFPCPEIKDMLKDPKLKKQTWLQLQAAIKKIASQDLSP